MTRKEFGEIVEKEFKKAKTQGEVEDIAGYMCTIINMTAELIKRDMSMKEEKINHLLKLIKENPDLPIVPMVHTECIKDDQYCYWMAEWGDADVDEYCTLDERIYFKKHDFEELVEDFIDNNYSLKDYEGLSDDELYKIAEREVEKYEWIKAIIVFLDRL